ncbi:hypothetical protein KIL84_001423 [Mauremys mutica]|uniref:C-X-C motif chemokine n=1 Tax=Mauremys mutica TaxID=74926 RepID=A0A9D3X000_9SAUR|nr:hypothetical protein KIL84_001423 [Mauremys mutica]
MGPRCPRAGRMRGVPGGMDGTQVSESRPDAGSARAGGMDRTQGVSRAAPLQRIWPPAGAESFSPSRAGAPMAGELRCQCLQTEAAVIHPKRVAHMELIPEGPHCGVPEIIATTKHGKKVCLDPTAPWVQLIVTRILNRLFVIIQKLSCELIQASAQVTSQSLLKGELDSP